MLLRFGVSNHLSIRDRQELSLTASSLKDRTEGLIPCSAAPRGSVVPAAVIYGANASGKTNVVDAIETMRSLVLESHTQGKPDGGVPQRPFALDSPNSKEPSRFDIDFVMDGVRYHYGFVSSDEAFESEWLYTFPKAHRRMLFERGIDGFRFGRRLGGANRIIASLTRRNSLFVSAAAQNDHEQLSRIYGYFRSFRSVREVSIPSERAWVFLRNEDPDQRVIDFLGNVGTGIIAHQRREIEIPEEMEMLHHAIANRARATLSKGVKIETNIEDKSRLQLGHRSREGRVEFFELDRESAGTRRLLVVLAHAFRALDEGLPLCIDELDASLHTHACESVLRLFCSPTTNPRGAQLIATTHDTNVMNSPMLIAEKAVDCVNRLGLGRHVRRKKDSFEERDEVWAVFDRDEHPRFDDAVKLCEKHGVRVGRSDPCFELWLILHEQEYDKYDNRRQVQRLWTCVMRSFTRHDRHLTRHWFPLGGKFSAMIPCSEPRRLAVSPAECRQVSAEVANPALVAPVPRRSVPCAHHYDGISVKSCGATIGSKSLSRTCSMR